MLSRRWEIGLLALGVVMVLSLAVVILRSTASLEIKAAVTASLVTAAVSLLVAALSSFGRDRATQEAFAAQLKLQRQDFKQRETERKEDFEIEQRRQREDSVLQALQYFGGRTQVRSVGVSVIDGLWDETPEFRSIFVPLLINQAIYLLEESKQESAKHELFNLRRIMDLLIRAAPERRHDIRHGQFYDQLLSAIADKSKQREAKG